MRPSSASENPNVGSCAAGEMQTVTLRFALAGPLDDHLVPALDGRAREDLPAPAGRSPQVV